jgi:L-serine deaminase
MNFIMQYKKAIVGAVGVVISAVLAALIGDGQFSDSEFTNVVVLAAGTISLGIAANTPGAKYVKALLAGIAAIATVVLSVYSAGITTAEWAQIGVAFLTAAGVYQLPNRGDYLDRTKNNATVQQV